MGSELWHVKEISIYDDSDDNDVLSLIHRKFVENVENMKMTNSLEILWFLEECELGPQEHLCKRLELKISNGSWIIAC